MIVNELPLNDTRIRFSIGNEGEERIYFYPDTPGNEYYCETQWSVLKTAIEQIDPDRLDQLNICLVGGHFIANLTVDNIHITNGGSGYTSPPEVIFSSSFALAESIIENGSVVGINLIQPGSHTGCTPLISFEGGGGSGAAAYCTLTGGYGGKCWPTPDENINKDISIQTFANDGSLGNDDWRAINLAHELGHALDLNHVTSSSGSCYDIDEPDDYLWDVFGLPYPGNCPHNSTCEDSWTSPDDACTNNIMGNKESHYFSPRQAGKMHRVLALMTTRRYVNEDVFIENEPLIVTNVQTWDFNIKFYRDIIIESGAELTISCNLVMPWRSSIIVKPGAHLIVDGGIITTDSKNHKWKGIQVEGNTSLHQYTIGGFYYQGRLTLKNGAVIENANTAILVGGYQPNGNLDSEKSGGIIQVLGNFSLTKPSASFINNGSAVHFRPYENYNPNNINDKKPNRSYFHNALFEINNIYISPNIWNGQHVRLYSVNGISFKGCTFTNESSHPNYGKGIYCATDLGKDYGDSGFNVSAICTSQMHPCPEETLDKCMFKNLEKGIDVFSTGIYTFTVEDAIFKNNSYGIKMADVNNAAILFCDFQIGEATATDGLGCGAKSSGYGIFMDNCTGFAIEENTFGKYSGTYGFFTGIRIAETNATDEIYLNNFHGISYANYTEGKNWLGFNIGQGLEFQCNENSDNWADFYVTKNDGDENGVQAFQGDPVYPSSNLFPSSAMTNYHFFNEGDHMVNYYYCPSPSCYYEYPSLINSTSLVNRQEASMVNECLSHYGSSGGGGDHDDGRTILNNEEEQQREQQYNQALTDYNNVKTLYESLKDGGNTEALKTEVETSWPTDMWELRAELLGKSPHLSMEVLKEAADKTEVLPESVLFEILAANPDELKKEELLKYLEDKESPLPQYMINILRQVATGTTYKTVLQQQMSGYNRIKTRAAHDMIRSLINDTITDFVSFRSWLDNLGGIRADHQIINTYLVEDNHTDALTLANMLPNLYQLEGKELTEYNYYMDMLNLQLELSQQNRSIFNLNSAEVNNLLIIAENSEGVAGARAKGILEFAYGYEYCNCLNVADTLGYKSSGMINMKSLDQIYGVSISVNPNPAKEWTSFNYNLPDNSIKGIIKIVDVTGKIVETVEVSGTEGQYVWDTRKIESGVYMYSFTVNGILKTGKIIIQK